MRQSAKAEIKLPARPLTRGKGRDIHRRVDYRRLTPPVLTDAPGHSARIGHEMVHPKGAGQIPAPQARQQQAHAQTGKRPGRGYVVGPGIPEVTHGRVAVTDMQAVRAGDHALGRAGLAGNDQIIAREVKLLQCQRHERKVTLVLLPAAGQTVDERCFNMVPGNVRGKGPAVQHMGEDVGLRVHAAERFQHPLAAGHADKPVVDKGHAHLRLPVCRRWRP